MSDWEIWAPTQAQLLAVIQNVVANRNIDRTAIMISGFMAEGFLNNGTRICINYYRNKFVPTGNTIDTPLGPAPELTRVAGVFAIMRWLHPTDNDPPQPSVASGVTLIPLPADSPIRFMGG